MQPISEDQFVELAKESRLFVPGRDGKTAFSGRTMSFYGTLHYTPYAKYIDDLASAKTKYGNFLFGPGTESGGKLSKMTDTMTHSSAACFACWGRMPGKMTGIDYQHRCKKLKFSTKLVRYHYKCGWDGVFAKVFRDLPSFDELMETKVWSLHAPNTKWTLWEFSALCRTIRAFHEQPTLVNSAAWLYHMFGHRYDPEVLFTLAAAKEFRHTEDGTWELKPHTWYGHTSWGIRAWDDAANFVRVLKYIKENGMDLSRWHRRKYTHDIGGTDKATMLLGVNPPSRGRRLSFEADLDSEKKDLYGNNIIIPWSIAEMPAFGRSVLRRTTNLLTFLESCSEIPVDWDKKDPILVNLRDVLPNYGKLETHLKEHKKKEDELYESYKYKVRNGGFITDEEFDAAAARQGRQLW